VRHFCSILLFISCTVLLRSARAEDAPPLGASLASRAPTISVLTFGPGDETFSKFGHDAIWVRDPRQPPGKRDLVFNYGTFRFDSPWLIMDFLKGKLSYWLSVGSLERTLAAYRAANRSVSVQELALSPEQALAMTAFLHKNARPEEAYYRYDYYRDNCATRIRDVLDRHLDGKLAAASRGPANFTYREHTRRLTVDSPFLFFGLDLAMGPLIDRPITEWEQMFLPAHVAAKLANVTDAQGVPVVRESRTLFQAQREPIPDQALGFRWGWLAIGAALGTVLYALSRGRRRWCEVTLAALLGGLGGLVGVLGAMLLTLWLLTDHDVTYWNQNVLLCPIWALALPVLAIDFARATPRRSGLMMRLVGAAGLAAIVALLLRLLVPGNQSTDPALSVFFPLWLGAAAGVWERCGRPLPPFLALRTKARASGSAASPTASHP
jgi:hypothetical protein